MSANKELHLLLGVLVLSLYSVRIQTDRIASGCLIDDTTPPKCEDYIDPNSNQPVFIPHLWNCSRYWECLPFHGHCLNECPEIDGGNLYFNYSVPYPWGPVCDWPENVNCTMGEGPVTTTPGPTAGSTAGSTVGSTATTASGTSTTTSVDECNGLCESWQHCSNGECVPECQADTDCTDPDRPVCSSGYCISGCRSNKDCPGHDEVCDSLHDNCAYCNPATHQCQSGCSSNANCNDTVCDENHICMVYLTSIEFKTHTCNGCQGSQGSAQEDGITVFLRGLVINDVPTCKTHPLDHADTIDYDNGKITKFSDKNNLYGCYRKDLNFGIDAGEIEWTSEQGEWTIKDGMIIFEWSNELLSKTCCCMDKTSLSPQTPKAILRDCKPCNQHPGCRFG